MNHWRTTLIGLLTIAGAVGHAALGILHNQPVDWNATGATVMAGVGFILSADAGTAK